MLSLVTTEAETPPVDAAEADSAPTTLLSCSCCCGPADDGTLIVILSVVGGEVVVSTAAEEEEAGADEIEDDEIGDDSRELILISLELLLSSAGCFVGCRIGLIVSFGTVCANKWDNDVWLPSATQSCTFVAASFGGIGLIVSFGIELELMLEC